MFVMTSTQIISPPIDSLKFADFLEHNVGVRATALFATQMSLAKTEEKDDDEEEENKMIGKDRMMEAENGVE